MVATSDTGWSDAPLLDGRPIGVMADLHANALALSTVTAPATPSATSSPATGPFPR